MHVPRCHHRGQARKVGYELADSAMFNVSLGSARGWHIVPRYITRCRGNEDEEARTTYVVRWAELELVISSKQHLHLFFKLEKKWRKATSSLGASCGASLFQVKDSGMRSHL